MDELREKLEALENKIDKLLKNYKELQLENTELKEKVQDLELKIEEYEKERALVVEKIESLVNRI
ncbi:hypothetical protein FHQ18_10595 [Deferribacter autotrophicus]|uniref:Cell division protein ZapB n=1 Tax=Deferribacter autotrophicus TaxID=500465 RepID=A0A5A8EZ93_9BACT|nr:hypothetical protein [Deferribacter autotrophicus]KAA0257010.1 hypothetical protein FHQ18_10595 [Deferribacter autotrophicus]